MDVLSAYAAECRAAGQRPATVTLRLSYLERLERDAGPLLGLSRSDLVRWLAGHETWKPETRQSARSAVRSFYRWAAEEELLAIDPAVRLRAVKVPKTEPHPTPDAVLESAWRAASDRVRLAISLGAWAGLRRSEIAGLRWLDWSAAGLKVVGKGGRERIVPVGEQLAELLAAERARRQSGGQGTGWRYSIPAGCPWVFPGRGGTGPASPWTIGDALGDALGPGWSGHSLRHRFATAAYRAQGDLLATQKLLGHSRPETTQRYADPSAAAALVAVAAAASFTLA